MHFTHVLVLLARQMSVLACCLLMAGQVAATPAQAAPSLAEPEANSLWPRIFYTAQQRLAIEIARRSNAAALTGGAAPAETTSSSYRLEGVSQGRQGATAWINGQALRQGQEHEGKTVYIANGSVRLHQSGEPDIVLRPGQQTGDPGSPPQDVVPAGALRRRTVR